MDLLTKVIAETISKKCNDGSRCLMTGGFID